MISFYRIKHWYPAVHFIHEWYMHKVIVSEERVEYDEIDPLTLPAAPSVTGVTP